MKKYITPQVKYLDIYEESLMIGIVSEENDNPALSKEMPEEDVDGQIPNYSIWDE